MSLPIKPICQAKDARRDGTSIIYLQYCFSAEKRTLLNTEMAIPATYWNETKHCIKNTLPPAYGNHEKLNDEIIRQVRLAEDLIRYAIRCKVANAGAFVKQAYQPELDFSTLPAADEYGVKEKVQMKFFKPDFFEQLDDYILTKKNKVSKATVTVFNNVKHHLQSFEQFRKQKIEFTSLDYDFYTRFIDYLTFDYIQQRRKTEEPGLKLNSIGKTVKQLRVFIKDRVRRKLIEPIDMTDFKIPEEEPDAVYLSYAEIGRIYNLDLSGAPHLIKDRNLFVLSCLTGLRFSDFSKLKPEDLRNDFLYKKQVKSDHWVVIPLRQEALSIFEKEYKAQITQVSNPCFNKNIKRICELAGISETVHFSFKKGNRIIDDKRPKHAWVTSHTARRSFCTNEFLASTPVKLIMNISGHKKEKDFYKYIRVTPEEAANKIKELWEKGGRIEAFGQSLKKVS